MMGLGGRLHRQPAAGGAPFDPTTIANCTAWIRADSNTNASGTVSQLTDKTTNGVNFTATGTAQPTLVASYLGGRAAILFNGTANYMDAVTGKTMANVITASAYTILSVVQLVDMASSGAADSIYYNEPAVYTDRSNAYIALGQYNVTTNRFRAGQYAAAAVTVDSSTVTFGTPYVVSHAYDGTNQSIALGTATANTVAAGNLGSLVGIPRLGAHYVATPTVFSHMYLFELIFYSRSLTTAERSTVVSGLKTYYGI